MSDDWFPRPDRAADITPLSDAPGSEPGELFELLASAHAVEWRDKVGVAGARDGSGKPATRLLAVGDQVIKTRLDLELGSLDDAVEWVRRIRERGEPARVWHPSKRWFVLRSNGQWLPTSVTRRLVTLRALAGVERRFAGWTDMLALGCEVADRCSRGLDLNPSNFGRETPGGRLYYIDDEMYPALSARDIAGAIAARIPEEPGVSLLRWRAWGGELKARMPTLSWLELASELAQYPLPERYLTILGAIIDAVTTPRAAPSKSGGAGPAITCVFADVHANLPALAAVLDEARELGANRFLFAGDLVGYGPHPRECIDRIAELRSAVLIRGNHDHAIATGELALGMNRLARRCAEWTLAELDAQRRGWLGELPVEHIEERWMAVHGAPKDPRKFLAYVYELTYEDNLSHMRQRSMPVCFYGHTHVPFVHVELPSGPTKRPGLSPIALGTHTPILINPGSVGQPRDGDSRASFALWHHRDDVVTFHRVAYDIGATIAALHAAELPAELEPRLVTGR